MTFLSMDNLKSIWDTFKKKLSYKADENHYHSLSDVVMSDNIDDTLLSKVENIYGNKARFEISDNIISYKYEKDDDWKDLINVLELREDIFTSAINSFFSGVISITATKTKTKYYIGEKFNTDDIIVTLNYSNGESEAVGGFIVTPITIDTSTPKIEELAIIYYVDGKPLTTTIGITVSDENNVLYELPEEKVFIASNKDYFDTGLSLLKSDIDFTLMIDFTGSSDNTSNASSHCMIHCMYEESPYPGLSISIWVNYYGINIFDSSLGIKEILTTDDSRHMIIIRRNSKSNLYRLIIDNSYKSITSTYNEKISESLVLGCYQLPDGTKGRFWNGTIHRFKIWNKILTDAEISKL